MRALLCIPNDAVQQVLRFGSHVPIGIRSGDYFRTLRLPLLSGRLLTKEDCNPGLQSVVINQAFAQQCWPGQDPLNRRIASKDFKRTYVVVGEVKNTLDWRRDTPQLPTVYEPIERIPMGFSRGAFMVRSRLSPEAFRNTVKDLGQQMEPSTPNIVFDTLAISDWSAEELWAESYRQR